MLNSNEQTIVKTSATAPGAMAALVWIGIPLVGALIGSGFSKKGTLVGAAFGLGALLAFRSALQRVDGPHIPFM